MSEYFDAVLTQNMNPIFNDTPEKVVEWLEGLTPDPSWQVCLGKTMQLIPVRSYLAGMKAAQEARIHDRNTRILQQVTWAMQKQDRATHFGDTDGMDLVAKQTAEAIIKIFEGEK